MILTINQITICEFSHSDALGASNTIEDFEL